MIYIGEIAALGTAFCWAGSSLCFTAAGKRVGSVPLNLIRLVMAFGMLSAYVWVVRGLLLPTDATAGNWFWLALSGLVGLTFGDLCLFRAMVLLDARLTMLVMTLTPPMAAVMAWATLGERLGVWAWAGMAMTVAGVGWVVTERHADVSDTVVAQRGVLTPREHRGRTKVSPLGVMLAAVGALGQAGGLVLGKIGLVGGLAFLGQENRPHYNEAAATQIRIIAGIAGFVLMFTVLRNWPRVATALRHRGGMGFAALGSLVGPFIGVTLAMVALRNQTGVAATIMSISPIILIPASALIHKERITWRAVIGSVVAVGGVAVLVWHQ